MTDPVSLHPRLSRATAFAPATVANVAVGFDVLGFAFDAIGDRVTVLRDAGPGLRISSVEGADGDVPEDPLRNTAGVALQAMIDDLRLPGGFSVELHKGIPLGSGMGGSAASAVGAVVAANHLLAHPLDSRGLLPYALAGEAAASGAPHADNAAPCLFGGLTAVVALEPLQVVNVPVPAGLVCVLVHPRLRVDTRAARELLEREMPLERHVRQSAHLAGFLSGCFRGDAELVEGSLVDLVAGPQRATLIEGFEAAKLDALEAGARGLFIAGSGPSVFTWVRSRDTAVAVERAVRSAFRGRGIEAEGWIGRPGGAGACVTESGGPGG